MSAMQEMLLNMILPKEEQEQLKRALTPENIKNFFSGAQIQYASMRNQLNRIEQNQVIIMKHLGLEPVNDGNYDNGTGTGEPARLAS